MRKLTGYIGALIIVFALMGSIFAGYALNVNGSSSVINEYERVTDVSGLYSHTQEPSYIDYNPASNYIGYGIEQTVYENTGLPMKRMLNGDSVTVTLSGGFSYNGKTYGFPQYNTVVIGSSYGYLYSIPGNPGIYWTSAYGDYGVSTITITWSNNVLTVSDNINTRSLNTGIAPFIYYPYDDYDSFFSSYGDFYYNPGIQSQFLGIGSIDPRYNNNNIFITGTEWTNLRCIPYGDEINVYPDKPFYFNFDEIISNGVHKGRTTVLYNYGGSLFALWGVLGPRYVYIDNPLGINYVESSRVNNYLINTDPGSTITRIDTIDLMGISAGDLFPNQDVRFRTALIMDDYNLEYQGGGMWARWIGPYLTPNGINYDEHGDAIHRYSLADILNTYNIPAGVDQLTITANSNDIRNYTPLGMNFNFDMNMCAFNINNPDGTYLDKMYSVAGQKDYIIYDLNDGICRLYSYDGVLKGSGTPSQIRVTFIDNTYSFGFYRLTYGDYPYQTSSSLVDMGNRARPFITIQSTINNPANNHYMDVTKGISIKSDNVVNVKWDNEYSNGNIQLLFRAEDTNQTFHNGIIVGDNTISIDYADSSYSITLNGGDPVAVGKWRNIVLNIDLRTGELSAIPVRTFNSYTNVVMDTASIVIGDMVNPAPTNTIEWTPTSNSLMFNVYSTAVFMNTYGVVMVNPQLDITEYFTDLNGFYRMRLYNFTVLGSSITVNGMTADVTNNSITIDEQTVQVKDMAITYADGHAYISDSNVNIDLGEVVNNNISMAGAWYFETELLKGYTSQKMVYTWDWGDFILNNTQFCIMYIGIALIGLIVARRYCSLSITDYIVLIASFAIALTVQVVA